MAKRTRKDYALLYCKGLAMGAADLIPGVSGGTIAFISGIYEELLTSLMSLPTAAISLIREKRLKTFWQAINGNFLLCLLLGIATSLVSLAHLMTFLLERYPEMLWAFFFGLIIASCLLIFQQIRAWSLASALALLSGTALAYYITIASPSQGSEHLGFVFISGGLAICAMILPGISGAFILLLLGMYAPMLTALKSFDLLPLAVFLSGCTLGLLAFSHALSWMFKNHHDATLALLAGFMIGSLNKVWPWKVTVSSWSDHKGKVFPLVQENISPFQYESLAARPSYLLPALTLMIFAALFVVLVEKYGRSSKQPSATK